VHKWLQGCVYINPDNIAQELGDWNNHELSIKAAEQAQKLREQLLKEKTSLAFETVFSAPDKIDFIKRAHQQGFYIRFFFVATSDPAINAARITKRYLQGGHEVPIPKIVNRYYRSIQQCIDVVPYVDRMDVFDNSRDGKQWTRLFKYGPNKKLQLYVNEQNQIPEWACSLYKTVKSYSLKQATAD
jgi:predicted ABC-type ATPase